MKLDKKDTKYKSIQIMPYLYDDSIPMNEKMFIMAMSLSMISAIFMALVSIITTGFDFMTVILLPVSVILMLAFTYFGSHYKKVELCTNIFVLFVIVILFPTLFFVGGANEGGNLAWNLLGFAYIIVLLDGKKRIIYLGIDFIMISACYIASSLFPQFVKRFADINSALIDSYLSMLLVAIFIAILILYQNSLISKQRDFAREQFKEIESLNIAQNNFFSNMSHEIRTPINTIIGLNEMTLRETNVSDEAIENAMNIESASKMLLTLINDILDISKIQSGKMDILPVQYDTKSLFSDVVNMIYVQAKEKNLNFKVNIDPDYPSILLCDEVRLKQVLINLLNNAVKYTKDGSVTLSVRSEYIDDKKIRVTYSVSDTGIGIRKENIPYLFDSFKRVDENNNRFIEGTGLGLSICKQLAELLDGQLSVDSVYTKGSTFHFGVDQIVIDNTPIGDVDFIVQHANMKTRKYHQSFEAPSARVLIVDDNELNRTVATKLLRDTRVQTDTAADGNSALELTRKTYYHIILMDHMMPEMDGIECAYQIKHQPGGLNIDTPILALTANVRPDSNEFYGKAGFDGYISKPISGAMLEASLLNYLPGDLITYIDLKSEPVQSSIIDSDKVYKKKCIISTNSTCDLGLDLISEYNISVIPYSVKTSGGQFRDGVEIDAVQLVEYSSKKSDQIVIVPPSVEEYEEYFSDLLNECDEIIHLCTSSMLSPEGLQNAYKAAASFGSIHIINTEVVSGGLGMLAMFASMLLKQGLTTAETIKQINTYLPLMESNVMLANSSSFYANNALSAYINKYSYALMLRPIIITRNAKLDVKLKYFGEYKKNLKRFIRNVFKNNERIDERFLLITYNGLSIDEIDEMILEIKKYKNFGMINSLKCSAVSYILVGNDAFGFYYFLKP